MPDEHLSDELFSVSRLPQEEELRFSAPPPEIEGYQILEKLGEAGQGQVWRAVQQTTGRQVALKVPRIGLLSSKKTLARFEREVEIAAHLSHPHIAAIIDSGVRRGLYYYAMDLIEGKHLDQYVKDNALSQRQILELMKVVCEAVQHAHQNGVIHRDLKPSNIIVTEEGHPYIVDFGLAKSIGSHAPEAAISLDGEAAGTPAYMSPEQAAGHAEQIDTRTDVYSLGAILFRLLTGNHPHDLSGSHHDVLHRISEQEVTRPRKLNPAIDRDLEALLLKTLENNPDRRYSSAAGLAEDIDKYLNRLPLGATPRSRIRRMNSFVRRHRLGVVVGVTACLLGLAAVIALATGTILISHERQRTQRALEREQEALGLETQARKEAIQERDLAYRNLYVAQIRLAPQYWEAGQIFRLKEMLDDYDPAPDEIDLRGWEWYYLLSLCHQDLMTLHGHTAGVTSVAWSPNGRLVASACKKGIIKLWDTTTGQECRTLRGHAGGVSKVAWSPDGEQLASAGRDGTARIWEIATGREVLRFSGHTGGVNAIAWSPDQDELATGSDDNTVRFWDRQTGEEHFVFKGHTARVQCLAWQPDGQYVASGDDQGWLRIWEAGTGREIQVLRPLDHDLWSVAWSPDGNCVASTGFGHPLIVWDIATGRRRQTIPLTSAGETVAWSPDGGLLAVATMSQLIQIWNAGTGQKVATLKGHVGPVNSVAFSRDGRRLLSAGDDEMVKIWDVNEPKSAIVLKHPKAAAVAWNPRGDVLASAGGGVMKLWDLKTWRECSRWDTPRFYMSDDAPEVSIAWNPEGTRLVAGRWGSPGEEIRVWNSSTGMEVLRLSKGSNPAWSPDGQHLAISVETVVEVWDLRRNSVTYRLTGHGGPVYSVSWSPGGDRLATGEWGLIRIWDGESGQLLRTMSGHRNWIGAITWSPDGGRLASGGWGQEIRIWDSHSGRQIATMTGHSGAITSLQWNPTGDRIASGASDNLAKVWDVATGREVLNLQGYGDTVRSVAWSPDGRRLATASQDGTVRICDATKGYEMRTGSSRTSGFANSGDSPRVSLAKRQFLDLSDRQANGLSPADGSDVGPLRTVMLRWTWGSDAVACRVYLGDDPDNLVLLGNVAAGQAVRTKELDRKKWYCWRVDTIRGDGSVEKGKLWSFSTGDMVGWWKLDETAGQIVADSSGRGKDGKLMGNPQRRQGHSGAALEFDGKDDYIRVEDESDCGIGLQTTLACWIRVSGFAVPWQPAISRARNGSWRLIRAGHGRSIEFACDGVAVPGTVWGNVVGTRIVDDGRWHHIVGTYDGTKLCLYVDGSLDVSASGSGRINLSSDPILIGASTADSEYCWNGMIDDVRIYNYALTSDEVQALCVDRGPGPLPRPKWVVEKAEK